MNSVGALLGFAMLALSAASPVRAQNDAGAMLDAHNRHRAAYCVAPLAWSAELAAQAQRYADRCVFNHDPGNKDAGENLAWGTSLSAPEAVDLWYDEVGRYSHASPGFSPATGHFTQLVWSGTRFLGCGGAVCGRYVYWVCRYSPPGNVEGEYRENVPLPCR